MLEFKQICFNKGDVIYIMLPNTKTKAMEEENNKNILLNIKELEANSKRSHSIKETLFWMGLGFVASLIGCILGQYI